MTMSVYLKSSTDESVLVLDSLLLSQNFVLLNFN